MTSASHSVPDTEANASSRVIAAYLRAHTDTDGLVVDPFCQSPAIVVEALALGRRVVAVHFNPLDALRTRLALTALPARDLGAAVTRLADAPKAGVSLREHLRRLYRTTCPQCGKPVIADYFIWERGHDLPKRVHYHCPACGDAGARDCDENDARVLHEIQPAGLHYWYVLDRVARHENSGRKLAASLLELYTPRNLYVLSNLVLKIEDLFSDSPVHDSLRLALLHCLELGSKLNPVPGEPAPAHASRLHPPPRFVEWNAWQLFEEAARRLATQQPVAPVALAARVQDVLSPAPSAGGQEPTRPARAFVGHMPVRKLVAGLPPGSVSLIWTQPPPFGRTNWALPYLWTGWLYGHEQSALLWPLVRRRNSDWPWYLQAVRGTLLALQKTLHAHGYIVLIGQSKGLAYHETLALAAAGANLRLESALYHPREPEAATKPFAGLRGDYHSTWVQGPATPPFPMSAADLTTKLRQIAVAAAEETLQERAEPAPFARLHCHIWEALARRGMLQRVMSTKELPAPLDWVREQVQTALEEEVGQTFLQLWEDGEDSECLWWLVQPPAVPSLTERVELAACEILEAIEAIGTTEFMQAVYARFPGMLTPDAEWVIACLKSYGQQVAAGRWALQEEDRSATRAQARQTILHILRDLGRRWGYAVEPGAQGLAVQWVQGGTETCVFAVLDSAALSPLLHLTAVHGLATARRFAIIPAARQDLLRLKLARSSLLRRQLVANGWQFIQDSDLRDWANQAEITLADLDSLVSLDPLATQSRTQLPLI